MTSVNASLYKTEALNYVRDRGQDQDVQSRDRGVKTKHTSLLRV